MAATANWWRRRVWISNSSTRTNKLVEEEIFGLATTAPRPTNWWRRRFLD
jgi:hypothetical protein